MPTVNLKVARWVLESPDSEWASPEGVSVSILEGETISDMAYRLAMRDEVFRKFVFERDGSEFGAEVLVILNGAFVTPQSRSETLLKDSDEVMLLPAISGG